MEDVEKYPDEYEKHGTIRQFAADFGGRLVGNLVNEHTSKDSWVYQLMDTNGGMLKIDNGGHTTNNHNLGARPFG